MDQKPAATADDQQRRAVEVLAYSLWERRGRPWGTPDMDWFMAQAEIQDAPRHVDDEPPTITAAKMVGSVLGSIAGLVTSLAHSFDSE